MTHWIRVRHEGDMRIGTLSGSEIALCSGDLFDGPAPTGERVALT